jgi:hypothetical protein
MKYICVSIALLPLLAAPLLLGRSSKPERPDVLTIVADDRNERTHSAGRPEFTTAKAEWTKWRPKSDAPSLSDNTKRKQDF